MSFYQAQIFIIEISLHSFPFFKRTGEKFKVHFLAFLEEKTRTIW